MDTMAFWIGTATDLYRAFFFNMGAEVADKTMLVTLALASRYPLRDVLKGVVCASMTVPFIGIALGGITHAVFPGAVTYLAAFLFEALVVWSLFESEEGDEEPELDEGSDSRLGVFGIAFWAFFSAEMADRTQAVTVTLAVDGGVLLTGIGSGAGLVAANLIAFYILGKLKATLPRAKLMYGAAALFFASGILMFAQAQGWWTVLVAVPNWPLLEVIINNVVWAVILSLPWMNPLAHRMVMKSLPYLHWAVDPILDAGRFAWIRTRSCCLAWYRAR